MKIQYASDLHLEFFNAAIANPTFFDILLPREPSTDLLVLAGDIGYPEKKITKEFIKYCCERWPDVVWVFGNHEYYTKGHAKYSMTMYEKEVIADDYMLQHKNLHVLHNRTLKLPNFPDLVIIGTPLWSHIPKDKVGLIYDTMNDCRYIVSEKGNHFDVDAWNTLHTRNVQFLKDELEDAHKQNKQVLVVTHHLPTFSMIQPKYVDSPINCAFATELDMLIVHPAVKAWICGHSHGQLDGMVILGEKQVLVTYNARGYQKEESNATFNPLKLLEL